MPITAEVVADSVSPTGHRLTTFKLRYPRFIHAEAKTHRVIKIGSGMYEETVDMGFMDDPNLSRNASSSRAIPVDRLIADIRRDPAMPVYWGAHQPGMQAGEELGEKDKAMAESIWIDAMDLAIVAAENMRACGLHKQIANRILEPWAHINVVVTATEWDNFWELRRHSDAQPEIKVLADAMWDAMEASTPQELTPGSWHLPFVTEEDHVGVLKDHEVISDLLRRVSVARCARVSYLTHAGKKPEVEKDLALYDMLVGSRPLHASPAEHQATPDEIVAQGFPASDPRLVRPTVWEHPDEHANFSGWRQYRKMIEKEIWA